MDLEDLDPVAAAADERVPIVGTHIFSATNVTSASELVAELDVNVRSIVSTGHGLRAIDAIHQAFTDNPGSLHHLTSRLASMP
jgi:hypothetical protein